MAERSTLKPPTASAVPSLLPQGEQSGKPGMPLGRPFTLIGSRNRAHLHLLSSSVSRNHACVISTGNGLYLRDLASRSGVTVNGRKIKEVALQNGDIIQVGSFKFRFNDPTVSSHLRMTPQPVPAMLEIEGTTLTAIEGRSVLIGRRPTCDIPLSDASLSNTHSLIFEVDGHRFIRDLGSRTGTLVNGKPVHHQMLEFGDQIRIGDTNFRYVSAVAPREEPEAAIPIELALEDELDLHGDQEPIGLEFDDEPTPEAGEAPEQIAPPPAIAHEDRIPIAPQPIPLDEPETREAESAWVPEPVRPAESSRVGASPLDFTADDDDFLRELDALPAEHTVTAPADVLPPTPAPEPAGDMGLDFLADDAEHAVTADTPADGNDVTAESPIAEPAIAPADDLLSEPQPAAPEVEAAVPEVLEPQPSVPEAVAPEPLVAIEQEHSESPTAEQSTPATDEPQFAGDEPISPAEPLSDVAPPLESEPLHSMEMAHQPEPAIDPEAVREAEAAREPEAAPELEAVPEPESALEPETVHESDTVHESEAMHEPETVHEPETMQEPHGLRDPATVHEQPAPAPLRVEDVDLSAVKFGNEPWASDIVETSSDAPVAPVPLLNLTVDASAAAAGAELTMDASSTVAGAAAASLPAIDEKTKQPRAPRKKPSTAARRPSRKKRSEEIDALATSVPVATQPEAPQPEASPTQPSDLADETATGAVAQEQNFVSDSPIAPEPEVSSTEEIFSKAGVSSAADFPPEPQSGFTSSESQAPAGSTEVVENTEPTLESAFELDPSRDPEEPAVAPSIEETSEAALTDTAFGRAVQDFAGPELGPLIENAPAEPRQAEVASASSETHEPAQSTRAGNDLPDLMDAGSDEGHDIPLPDVDLSALDRDFTDAELSLEAPATDPEHTLTGNPDLDHVFETYSSATTSSPAPAAGGADSELDWDIPADLPAPGSVASEEEELFELPESLEEPPGNESQAVEPSFPASTTSGEPAAASAAPAPPPAPAAPPTAAPGPAMNPFFGMGRDLNSFIGGMPLQFPSPPHPGAAPATNGPQVRAPAAPKTSRTEPDWESPRPAAPAGGADALTFSDDPAPIPELDEELLRSGEPLELFDETAEQLDAIPDSLDAIGDVSGALGEPMTQPPPPRQGPSITTPAAPAGRGAAPPAARAKPATPPPPPRTSPLRSFTASPLDFTTDNSSTDFSGSPLGAGRAGAQGRAGAFTGLTRPPIREADVFSQTAFPPMDEAFFAAPITGAARKAPAPPAAALPPAHPPAASPPAAVPQSAAPVQPASTAPAPGQATPEVPVKLPRDRRREAIPPNRQTAFGRAPGAKHAPAPAHMPPTAPPDAARSRRPWWKNIRILLPLLVLVTIAAVAVIMIFFPPKARVHGTLQIQGLDKIGIGARHAQIAQVRSKLVSAELLTTVAARLKQQNVPPGFTQSPMNLDALSASSSFDDATGSLIFSRDTTDATGDTTRVQAILAVLYEEYGLPLKDRASSANRRLDDAAARLPELEREYAAQEAQAASLTSQIRTAAGAAANELLVDSEQAAITLADTDQQLQHALTEAAEAVGHRRDELRQAGAAGQREPRLQDGQIKQTLDNLNGRLRAAQRVSTGGALQAATSFENALGEVEQQLTRIPSGSDTRLEVYLSQDRRALATVRQLLARQQDGARAVPLLQQQLADRREAHLRQVWKSDTRLNELTQERNAAAGRAQNVADGAASDAAARIRGVIDDLDQKIDSRRGALATGSQFDDDLQQNLQQAIERSGKDGVLSQQRIAAELSRMSEIPAPLQQQSVMIELPRRVAAARAAGEQYASAALQAGDAGAEAGRIESEIAELQAQLDSHQESAGTAISAMTALDTAQRTDAKAAAQYVGNRNLLLAARQLTDARGRVAELKLALDSARADRDQRAAAAVGIPVVIQPTDASVSVVAGPDQRGTYLVIALGAIALLFAVPLWRAVGGSPAESEFDVPFANAVIEPREVPGTDLPDDYGSLADFDPDENAALA